MKPGFQMSCSLPTALHPFRVRVHYDEGDSFQLAIYDLTQYSDFRKTIRLHINLPFQDLQSRSVANVGIEKNVPRLPRFGRSIGS